MRVAGVASSPVPRGHAGVGRELVTSERTSRQRDAQTTPEAAHSASVRAAGFSCGVPVRARNVIVQKHATMPHAIVTTQRERQDMGRTLG